MKKLILLSLLLSFNSMAGIQIISDLDDTIKITNSGNIWESIGYGSARRKVYAGMPEFLAASRSYVSALNVISSSPRILKYQVNNLLEKHEIQTENIVLNRNFNRPGHTEYKTNAIKTMLEASNDSFILMGDDVGEDPEIYDAIIKLYPNRILASYIHIVKNRSVPATAIKYFTTLDLAIREHQAGRLAEEHVSDVIASILNVRELESVFPEFTYCPTERSDDALLIEASYTSDASALNNKLTEYCLNEWDD